MSRASAKRPFRRALCQAYADFSALRRLFPSLALWSCDPVANRHRRIEDPSDLPAFSDDRPPIVEKDFERPPHRDPSRDDEAFAKDLPQWSRLEREGELRKREKADKHSQPRSEAHLTSAYVVT